MKLRFRLAPLLCLCVLGLSACGSGDEEPGSDASSPAAMVPADAPVYFDFASQPSDDQKQAIDSMISRFSEFGLGEDTGLDDLIQKGLDESGEGFSYEADIQSWLGERTGFAVTGDLSSEDPSAVAAIEVTDEDAARDFFDKAAEQDGEEVQDTDVDGTDAFTVDEEDGIGAFADGFLLVASDEDSLRQALDAGDGDSLADSSDFTDAFGALPDDNLASVYLDPQVLLRSGAADVDPDDLGLIEKVYGPILENPVVFALTATDETIAVDAGIGASEAIPGGSGDLSKVPEDAVGAFAFGDLGSQLEATIEQLSEISKSSGGEALPDIPDLDRKYEKQVGFSLSELEDKLGSGDIWVRGEFPDAYVIGLDLEIKGGTDGIADGIKAAVARQATGVVKVGPPLKGTDGFSLTAPADPSDPTDPRFIDVELDSDSLILQASPDQNLLTEPETGYLEDNELFSQAREGLGDSYEPGFFLDLGKVVQAAIDSGSTADPMEAAIAQAVAGNLSYLVAGSQESSDRTLSRLVLGLAPED